MKEKNDKYKVSSIGKQPLSDRIYEVLKSAIVSGDLAPDTRLVETDIAAQMKVSPTPVREAFKRLSAEGFVTIMPWQGVRVRVYDDLDIIETYECREYLEALAAKLTAKKIDNQGVKKLQQVLKKSTDAKTPTEVARFNSDFHNIIIVYSGNNRLKKLLSDIHDIILRDRHITAYIRERRNEIHEEHQEILQALKDHNENLAEQAMRRHVNNGFANFMNRTKTDRKVRVSIVR
jgi:DNA-binding GntR family transcriptional regulator